MTGIRAIAVVVPARNEGALIGPCIESILLSADRLRENAEVEVSITVVADGCLDQTVDNAARYETIRILATPPVGVGAARHLGVQHAMGLLEFSPDELWIANTDADSTVSESWLINQLHAAEAGAQVRIGAVMPDFRDLSNAQANAWTLSHQGGAARGHIHGANLGILASVYLACGGFRAIALHEDVELVRRAERLGAKVIDNAVPDVVTSGRIVGRAPGGYAAYLAAEMQRAEA